MNSWKKCVLRNNYKITDSEAWVILGREKGGGEVVGFGFVLF